MKRLLFKALLFTSALGVAVSADAEALAERGAWFREARFGMFIHWGIYSIPAKGEWSYANDKYAPGEYEANAKRFNPVNYNPREWAKLAKSAGMKYAVLTSRHHDGFCMFDSHFTDYKITKSPYGKDAVREFLEAFRAEGLKVGLYHSLPDWTHPGYADTESPGCIRGGKKTPHVPTPEQYASFTNLVYNHVNQLTTEYGKLDLLFLDYTSQTKANVDCFGRDRLLEMIYSNQPDILVNDRLSYYKDNCRDFDCGKVRSGGPRRFRADKRSPRCYGYLLASRLRTASADDCRQYGVCGLGNACGRFGSSVESCSLHERFASHRLGYERV